MAKRKYTRKQLRKPDEFISFWSKVFETVRENAPRVIVSVLVAILIVAGVWTWSYFASARAAKTTGAFAKAFDIYNQTVFPMETKLPPSEDGIPRFKTNKAKLEASDKEFTKVLGQAGGGLKPVASLMRAGVRYELGRYTEAIKDYKAFLASGSQPQLKYNAREGIAYCYEGLKQWDKALAAVRELPRDGEKKWRAMYHEGRLLAKKGQKKDAVKVLKKVVEGAKAEFLKERAGDQLTLIESGK